MSHARLNLATHTENRKRQAKVVDIIVKAIQKNLLPWSRTVIFFLQNRAIFYLSFLSSEKLIEEQ